MRSGTVAVFVLLLWLPSGAQDKKPGRPAGTPGIVMFDFAVADARTSNDKRIGSALADDYAKLIESSGTAVVVRKRTPLSWASTAGEIRPLLSKSENMDGVIVGEVYSVYENPTARVKILRGKDLETLLVQDSKSVQIDSDAALRSLREKYSPVTTGLDLTTRQLRLFDTIAAIAAKTDMKYVLAISR